MATKVIVQSAEEELGTDWWVVSSETKTKEEILKCCEIAEKYAQCCFWENDEEIDEHFDEMADYRENTNGEDAFNHYLEKFCDCKVSPLGCDFKYEW